MSTSKRSAIDLSVQDSAFRILSGTVATELWPLGIEPTRYFFLEPQAEQSPLEIASLHSPLNQARDYISDRKLTRR